MHDTSQTEDMHLRFCRCPQRQAANPCKKVSALPEQSAETKLTLSIILAESSKGHPHFKVQQHQKNKAASARQFARRGIRFNFHVICALHRGRFFNALSLVCPLITTRPLSHQRGVTYDPLVLSKRDTVRHVHDDQSHIQVGSRD